MRTVANEPQAEYKTAGWQQKSILFSSDDSIQDISDGVVKTCPQNISPFFVISNKPKFKLSSLRGKMTKQSEKEIDDQISDLRSEWDRNI